jgi:hypothetical protein
MSDCADEEAARLSNLDRDTREESQWVCDQIASAIRSAFQRGKVEGMRDAELLALGMFNEGFSLNCERWDIHEDYGKGRHDAADLIKARATALEQENKD